MGAAASAGDASSKYESHPHTRERRRSSTNMLGGGGTNDLILHGLAQSTKFEKAELKTLQESFIALAVKQGNPNTITEDEFREALAAVGIVESDQFILHQLFAVMDKQHDGQVNFKDFVTCASVMVSGSLAEKLHFSFELYCTGDGADSSTVAKEDMCNILKHLNTTASWFGDPSLSEEEIATLVGDVFAKNDVEKSGTLSYKEYMNAVSENPVLVQFLAGKGTVSPSAAKLQLPIWWIDYDFSFSGAMKGQGKEFLAGEELSSMIMECKKNKVCKASTVIEKTHGSGADEPDLYVLRQEWHGPFEDKVFLESAFAKKCESTEGVEAKLTEWKSVDFK